MVGSTKRELFQKTVEHINDMFSIIKDYEKKEAERASPEDLRIAKMLKILAIFHLGIALKRPTQAARDDGSIKIKADDRSDYEVKDSEDAGKRRGRHRLDHV